MVLVNAPGVFEGGTLVNSAADAWVQGLPQMNINPKPLPVYAHAKEEDDEKERPSHCHHLQSLSPSRIFMKKRGFCLKNITNILILQIAKSTLSLMRGNQHVTRCQRTHNKYRKESTIQHTKNQCSTSQMQVHSKTAEPGGLFTCRGCTLEEAATWHRSTCDAYVCTCAHICCPHTQEMRVYV